MLLRQPQSCHQVLRPVWHQMLITRAWKRDTTLWALHKSSEYDLAYVGYSVRHHFMDDFNVISWLEMRMEGRKGWGKGQRIRMKITRWSYLDSCRGLELEADPPRSDGLLQRWGKTGLEEGKNKRDRATNTWHSVANMHTDWTSFA